MTSIEVCNALSRLLRLILSFSRQNFFYRIASRFKILVRRLNADLKMSGTKSFFPSKIEELNVFAHEVKKMTDMGVKQKNALNFSC